MKLERSSKSCIIHQNNASKSIENYEPFGSARPFGAPLSAKQEKTRLGFIDKEQDKESSLADHGVRKYDYETGRFISCDALWGKYIDLNPYQYSGNDPIRYLDENGMAVTWTGLGYGVADITNNTVTANNGKKYDISTASMNCAGYALLFCNGQGPMTFDNVSHYASLYYMEPEDAYQFATDEGYSDAVDVTDSKSWGSLERGEVLFVFMSDGYNRIECKHLAVATGENNSAGVPLVSQVVDSGVHKSEIVPITDLQDNYRGSTIKARKSVQPIK